MVDSFGKDLGLSTRSSEDTTGRLRDDFESVDYFESNTNRLTVNVYNIKVDKTYITGSVFIIGHPEKGQLDDDFLGLYTGGGSGSSVSRFLETKIWEDYTEEFDNTGSMAGSWNSASWGTSGSITFNWFESTGSKTTANGLQAYYNFDSDTNDSTIGGHDLINSGATNRTDGYSDGCYSFNGTSNYMYIPNFEHTGSSGSYLSVFGWFKRNTTSDTYLCGQYDLNNNRAWTVAQTSGSIRFTLSKLGLSTGSVKEYRINTIPTLNTWYHTGFTWNDGTLKVYLNGVETGSTQIYNGSFNGLYASTSDITFGCCINGLSIYGPWTGSLDEWGIWNRVLNSGEIGSMYSIGSKARAQSSMLSTDIQITDLTLGKITTLGTSLGSLERYVSLNNGSSFTLVNNAEWTTITTAGSNAVWRLQDRSGSAIVSSIKLEWKSSDT